MTGKYLTIEITHVRAGRVGAFSGPKFMTVRGALIENGKEIADFEAKRGAMKARNTCSMLDKAEKELGSDIGQWLEHPRPHSQPRRQVTAARAARAIAIAPSPPDRC